jgi:dTDP-4-dehydrorhamnose 3,5-epimerase
MTNSRYQVEYTPLAGLKRVTRRRLGDARGYLERLYCDEELLAAGFDKPVRQINRTVTREVGSIRGMHFQYPPHAEIKFVSCLRGSIFDVAVDLRRGSPTFLHWHGEVLSGDNAISLFIPEGFAHGLQTLSDDVEMLYLHTESYAPQAEGGLNALDPMLAIAWPITAGAMSDRDRGHSLLSSDFTGIEL